MALLQRIEEYTLQQRDSKQLIAEMILENKKEIQHLSMEEIAKRSFTSKSALVRFGKSLGFEGWKDFYKELIAEIHYEQVHFSDVDPNIPFDKSDTYLETAQKIATIQMESIQDTVDKLDESTLEAAVTILRNATRIVVFGISPNNLLGDIFRRKMASIGKSIEIAQSGEFGMVSRSLTKKDAAIFISYSGNDSSREPLKFVGSLKANNVPLIGITSDGGQYLIREIETVLFISTRERLYKKISNFSSEESILFILNILFASYFSRDYLRNYNYKVENSRNLEGTRKVGQKELKD
ncbi:MurR/RpiR family transcriptional regulator [Enterococcus sp. LJL90]